MRNKIPVLVCFLFFNTAQAQITYLTSYTNPISLVKLHVSGYKYVETDAPGNTITIYNTDHTVFKSITIPPQPIPIQSIGYISEHLFDLDNDIEYYITDYAGPPPYCQFKIYNEDGSLVFGKDSASLNHTNSNQSYGMYISDPIFYDGISTKMKLQVGFAASTHYEVYELPGSVTCIECTSGIVTGMIAYTNEETAETEYPVFYPNPTNGYIKINYKLPEGSRNAKINVYDNTGKLLEIFDITSTFDCIYLSSKYANGLCFFDLIINGEKIKTEKIIINR